MGAQIGVGWLGSDLDLASFVAGVLEQLLGGCACVCVGSAVGSAGGDLDT